MLDQYLKIYEEQVFDYEEALQRLGVPQEKVDLLRESTKGSRYVPKIIHDKFLLIFVNSSRENEKASKWLHVYYKTKTLYGEFFNFRDPELPEIQNAFEKQHYAIFPMTPKENFVFYHGIHSTEPKDYDFDVAVKIFLMMGEAALTQGGPRPGAILIFDLKGVKFSHIFRPSIHSVRKGLEFLQCGNPLPILGIHVLNSFWFMDLIQAMIKPFLSQKYYDMIQLHPIGSSCEKLFEHDVPRSHIPKDLGGDLPSTVREMHEKTQKLLHDMRNYFIVEEKQKNRELDEFVNSDEYIYKEKYQ